MTILDALDDKGLTQERLQRFVNNVDNEDIEIYKDYNSKKLSCKKESLIKDFFQSFTSVQENDILTLQTSSVALNFFGKDFLWWTKTSKRLEKLESILTNTQAEKKETKPREKKIKFDNQDTTYFVGVATLVDNELTNIRHFSGNKQQCIEFINNEMISRFIDSFLNTKVVINLAFDTDEFNKAFADEGNTELKNEYKHNLEMWYTLDELEEMGAITVK